MAEGLVDHLVGRVQYAGHVSAACDGLEGESQTAELLQVGLEELQRMGEQVEAVGRERQPVGIGEGVLDGQPHVGHAELRLHAAVAELHGAVDDALGMDEHLYPFGGHAKEPFGLDDLKALVHERCRVDGDLRAHVPCRVAQGVGSRHLVELSGVHQSERSARTGEQDFLHGVVAFAHEALEDGRMLAVDGQYGHVVLHGQLADELACDHECLLVGEAYFLMGADGMHSWRESGKAYHGGKHHIDGSGLHDVVERLGTGVDLDVRLVGQQLAQLVVAGLVGNDHGGGMEPVRLLGKQLHAVVGRQAIHLKQVAVFLNDLECLCADASGRTENGYLLFHFSS